MSDTEAILKEINQQLGGVPPFWKTLSKYPEILGLFWGVYGKPLASGTIPKPTKLMIAYEAALADGCPRCVGGFRRLLEVVGIDKETIDMLKDKIGSTSLGEETKNTLVFTYGVAKNPQVADDKFIYAFERLLGEAKLIEAGAWVNSCKMLMNVAHTLNTHMLS